MSNRTKRKQRQARGSQPLPRETRDNYPRLDYPAPSGFTRTSIEELQLQGWGLPMPKPITPAPKAPDPAELKIRFNGKDVTPYQPPTASQLDRLVALSIEKDTVGARKLLEEIMGRSLPENAQIEIGFPNQKAPRREPSWSPYSYTREDVQATSRMLQRQAREREALQLPGDSEVDYWSSPPKPAPRPDSAPKTVALVDALADAVNYLDGAPEGSRRDAISKVIDCAIEVCAAVGGAAPKTFEAQTAELQQSQEALFQLTADMPKPRPPGGPPEPVPDEVAQLLRNHVEQIQQLTKQVVELRRVARVAQETIERSYHSHVPRETWNVVVNDIRGRT